MKKTLVLLKCRPTPAQLADRLTAPMPEGVELYLDAADLGGDDWLTRTTELLGRYPVPADFVILVEGPVRSLDDSFFDLTVDSDGNRETVRRLAVLGKALGAAAATIHAIAPRRTPGPDWEAWRSEALLAALPLLRYYADTCAANNVKPLIENIPPVARQRESAYWYTPIGVAIEDLLWLASRVPGVEYTVDLSHAQLYLNARRLSEIDVPAEAASLIRSIRTQAPFVAETGRPYATTLEAYCDVAASGLVNVHVSNASGLLGEGMAYGEGDVDLDRVIGRLIGRVDYLVTETIDPDPNHAMLMREAQARLLAVRARS